MTTTITDGATTITATLSLGHDVSRESRNVVHPILGRPDPDITLREASLRTGTLRLLFENLTDAYAGLALHAAAAVLTYADTDAPAVGMNYVVAGGSARLTLDDETRIATVVEASFQEVAL